MNHIFSIDGKIYGGMSFVANLAILNVLWIITSIPLFTMGAASVALYECVADIRAGKTNSIEKKFLISFMKNFRQSTLVWVIYMILFAIDVIDIYVVNDILGQKELLIIFYLIATIILGACIFSLGIMSKFTNTTKKVIKYGFLFFIGYLPFAILLIFVSIIPAIVIYYIGKFNNIITFFILVFGVSIEAYMHTEIFKKVFQKYSGVTDEGKTI